MYLLSFIDSIPVALKMLNTHKLKTKGFMGWNQPPNDHYGLLFHHKHSKPQSYWMHTVPFDLDCIGFDDNDKIIEILSLKAYDKTSKRFSNPVRNVVEVKGGWCHKHGIKPGSKLVMRTL